MKGKEKRLYTGGKILMERNIYDDLENLPSWEEFKIMGDNNPDKAKVILERAKKLNSIRAICDKLKIKPGTMYPYFRKVGVEYGRGKVEALEESSPRIVYKVEQGYERYADDINNLPNLEDLKMMDKESAKNILSAAKSGHTAKDLAKYWNTSTCTIYKVLFPKYGIQPSGVGGSRPKKEPEHVEVQAFNPPTVYDYDNLLQTVKQEEQAKADILQRQNEILQRKLEEMAKLLSRKGFSVNFKGEYKAEFINNRVLNILNALDTSSNYKINLEITEIKEE
jgi:hypothetical protein